MHPVRVLGLWGDVLSFSAGWIIRGEYAADTKIGADAVVEDVCGWEYATV